MKKKLLVQASTNKSGIFEVGTELDVTFENNKVVCKTNDGRIIRFRASYAHKYLGAPFMKEPSLKTLEKWSNDGIAKTITGERIEPDGIGTNGAPSWLLALGVV